MPNETAREANDDKLLQYAVEIMDEIVRRGLLPAFMDARAQPRAEDNQS